MLVHLSMLCHQEHALDQPDLFSLLQGAGGLANLADMELKCICLLSSFNSSLRFSCLELLSVGILLLFPSLCFIILSGFFPHSVKVVMASGNCGICSFRSASQIGLKACIYI